MSKATIETPVGTVTLRQRGGRWYARKQRGKERRELSLGTTDLNDAIAIAQERIPRYWLGVKEFSSSGKALPGPKEYSRLFQTARRRAGVNKVDYSLGPDDEAAIIKRSSGFCEVTGIPFSLASDVDAYRAPYRPSLDRINAALGYTPSNVRLVCTAVNWALADWGLGVFDRIASTYVARKLTRGAGQI